MKLNRKPVTVRLNIQEQADLLTLQTFWKLGEKEAVKFAIQQLVIGTKQLAERAKQEAENEKSDSNNDSSADAGVSTEQNAVAPSDAAAGNSPAA